MQTNWGVEPGYEHYYKVLIENGTVRITETYTDYGKNGPKVYNMTRAELPIEEFDLIRVSVRNLFNRRTNRKFKYWTALTLCDRLLGKELCLLFWMVDQSMQAKNALKRWVAMYPEERWDLYRDLRKDGVR